MWECNFWRQLNLSLTIQTSPAALIDSMNDDHDDENDDQAIPILMHASRIQGATQDCTRLTLGEHTRYGNDCTVMIV